MKLERGKMHDEIMEILRSLNPDGPDPEKVLYPTDPDEIAEDDPTYQAYRNFVIKALKTMIVRRRQELEEAEAGQQGSAAVTECDDEE